MIRVALINTYLQGRQTLIPCGEYPAHHLWGVDHLPEGQFEVIIIPHSGTGLANRAGRWLSRLTRMRFGDLDQEWEIWKKRREMDIVYVANGGIFMLLILRALGLFRPKIVRWTYTPRMQFPWWTLRDINLPVVNKGTDLLLCLTHRAANAYRQEMPFLKVTQMDWGADMEQFRPGPRDKRFFFACGKTNRNYDPLLRAAPDIPAPIHLVVHRAFLDGYNLAPNVYPETGSPDGMSDRGISYLRCELGRRPVVIATGGAISFFSGGQASIPRMMDRLFLGWLIRIIHDPKRFLTRYLGALALPLALLRIRRMS